MLEVLYHFDHMFRRCYALHWMFMFNDVQSVATTRYGPLSDVHVTWDSELLTTLQFFQCTCDDVSRTSYTMGKHRLEKSLLSLPVTEHTVEMVQ